MKLSTVIKISLSALAITVSMPMKGEAMQAAARMRAAHEARLAAEQAERERLAAEALAQQQAAQQALLEQPLPQAQQDALEQQRRREEEARQQALEEQRQREAQEALVRRQQEEQRQREAQQALARQQEAQRQQREAQEALVRHQQEEQRQREAQQALARQQEEQRQREEAARQQEAQRQQREAQEALVRRQQEEQRQREEAARQQEAQRQQREAQEVLARQQEALRQQALLQQQAQAQALGQQQEKQRKREAAALQSDLHPAWALFRDIKANYLIFTDTSGMGEQKAREITTREIKDYDQKTLIAEVEKFTNRLLTGNELHTFKEKFNALLKESPGHRLALIRAIQVHSEEEIKNRQTAKAEIEQLEKQIQGIDNQTEALEKQLQKENLPQDKQMRKNLKAKIKQQKDDLYEQRHLLIDQRKEADKVLDIAHFAYFNPNPDERMSTEDKIKAVVDAALLLDPQLGEKAALFFARSISYAPQSGTNIDHRIGYALQALEMMKLYNKQLKFQDLEISPKTNRDFNQAKSNLSPVHRHIQENFDGQDPDAKRLDNTNFKKAIKTLMAAIEMGEHEFFNEDSERSLSEGYHIAKLNRELAADQKACKEYFEVKQMVLQCQVNPLTPDHFYFSSDKTDFNLFQEWNTVKRAIDSITLDRVRHGCVLSLCYDNLTYNDIYASLFDINLKKTTKEDIKAIEDRVIFLADKRNMIDTAVCEEIAQNAARDPDGYVYFKEGNQNYRLKSTEIAESRRYFKYQMKTNFEKILTEERKKYHFMERVKHIFDTVPKARISPEIVNLGRDSAEWKDAFEEAQLEIAARIIPCLDDCDGGMSRKLTKLEYCYGDVLGSVKTDVILLKEIATMIREIKMDRISETGNHPQYDTGITSAYEEHATAPEVLTQRLRGPLGLLGEYASPVAPFYGKPLAPQNQPVQIVKNIFLPNQPARSYTIYGDEQDIVYEAGWEYQPRLVNGHPVEVGNGEIEMELVEEVIAKKVDRVIRQQQVAVKNSPLTLKTLIGKLKAAYEHEDNTLTFREYVDDFVGGDLLLLRDRGISADNAQHTVFFTARTLPNEACFFHILKRLGLAKVLPMDNMSEQNITTQLYTCHVKAAEDDEDDIMPKVITPGMIRIKAHNKTLNDLINEEPF